MDTKAQNKESPLSIGDLYPHLSEEQCRQAEENLERYLQVAIGMYERIRQEEPAYAQFKALTASKSEASMHGTRSIPSNQISPQP